MAWRTRPTKAFSLTSPPLRMRSFLMSLSSIRKVSRRSLSRALSAAFKSVWMRSSGALIVTMILARS